MSCQVLLSAGLRSATHRERESVSAVQCQVEGGVGGSNHVPLIIAVNYVNKLVASWDTALACDVHALH